ncbi:response regulator [Leptolyngbya ohadii]|uniref:response regulator n=1 Tax=Leptolyngbya ohadii TaxID=1962290 RepID=UPI000B59FFD4|nr:response regulator [Leptolyngbya ohadii]
MFAVIQPKIGSAEAVSPLKKRILVVDDEAPIRLAVRACLELSGIWEVRLAASGAEGLEMLKMELFDVILLDVMMPKMDGFTFLQTLRSPKNTAAREPDSSNSHVPVILLTATAHLVDAGQAEQLGVVAVIAKPFQPMNLTSQIVETLQSS